MSETSQQQSVSQNNAPTGQRLLQISSMLARSTRTYISRADRDVIRFALDDFQAVLHEIESVDTMAATTKVKEMARNFKGQYQVLFERIKNIVGNSSDIHVEDIEIGVNRASVDVDNI